MKRLLPILLVWLLAAPLFADVLYLNEGEEHVGALQEIATDVVRFREVTGSEAVFPLASTAHVLLSKLREGDEFSQVASLTDPLAVETLANLPDPARFPDNDYVTLYRGRHFVFQPDGSVEFDRRELVQVLREPGLDKGNRSVYVISDREKLDLVFAHTYAPDGRVFHITDDAVSEESLNSSTPEYDRLKKLKLALKKVDLGSVIDLRYRITTRKPEECKPYLMEGTFGEREPVLREEMSVTFPEGRTFEKITRQWTGPLTPTFTETKDPAKKTVTWRWSFADPKGFIPEQNMPPRARVFPNLSVFEKNDWNVIARAFATSVTQAAPTPAKLDAFIAEAGAASQPTPLMKARCLYDAILRKIRGLDLNFYDLGRVEPVPVDVALTKRYGNPQARLCLLHFALQRLGIPSRFGFGNSWNDGGMQEDVVSLGQSPYPILRIEIDGQVIYVHGDNDYLPFGFVPISSQGAKAAFLSEDGSKMVFETLPEGGAIDNRFDRQVQVSIDRDGTMDVQDTRCFRGPFEVNLRGFRSAKDRQKQMYAEKIVKKVHPKAQMVGYTFSNLDDMQAPVIFALRYRIPEAAIKASDHLLAFRNLWVSYDSSSASLASRTFPMEYWATEETTNTIVFTLPDGFSWVPWSGDVSYACGCLKFSATMAQTGQNLVFADRFTVARKQYGREDTYPHYRAALLKMSEIAKQWIILEKK